MINFWGAYIRELWTHRLKGVSRVALFGAGEHSNWLLDVVRNLGGASVVALIDDNAEKIREVKGLPVVLPESVARLEVEAVVISSDANELALFNRAREALPGVRLVRLYDSLPPGPYDKQGQLPNGIDTLVGPHEAVNLDTVVSLAMDAETKREIIRTLEALEPDPYVARMLDGYRRAMNRFGDRWKYIDLWSVLFAYAALTAPKRYLEIGTRRGHSLALVCAGCLAAGYKELDVVSCDLWIANYAGTDNPGPDYVADQMKRVGHDRPIRFVSGTTRDTLPELFSSQGETFDLITVDGDHSRDGARADLDHVAPRANLGGMIAFDDINHPQHKYLGGVWNAVMAFHEGFETYVNPRNHTGIAIAIRYQ